MLFIRVGHIYYVWLKCTLLPRMNFSPNHNPNPNHPLILCELSHPLKVGIEGLKKNFKLKKHKWQINCIFLDWSDIFLTFYAITFSFFRCYSHCMKMQYSWYYLFLHKIHIFEHKLPQKVLIWPFVYNLSTK